MNLLEYNSKSTYENNFYIDVNFSEQQVKASVAIF